MTTTRRLRFLSSCATFREVWLFPDPVRTAHTETTGTLDLSMVVVGPISLKSAPLARTCEALCMTYSWDTSLYANTTSCTSCFLMSSGRSSSGCIGMPLGYCGPASCGG